MFVQSHMSANPLTARPDSKITEAASILQQHGYRQLPVVNSRGDLLGIVTDRDIRSAMGFDPHLQTDLRVEEIMSTNLVTITQDATLEEAVRLLYENLFGALPVLSQGRLVGIITRHDILKAFYDVLGLDQPGFRIEIAIPHGAEDIAHVMAGMKHDDQLISLVAARLRSDGSEPVLYMRIAGDRGGQLERRLKEHGAILLAPEKPPRLA